VWPAPDDEVDDPDKAGHTSRRVYACVD
jgi:hypothetical protein